MGTRCKFMIRTLSDSFTTESVKNEDGTHTMRQVPTRGLEAYPVYSSDENSENAKFWRYTPVGELKLGTVNAAVLAEFKPGDEIYIDISRAADYPRDADPLAWVRTAILSAKNVIRHLHGEDGWAEYDKVELADLNQAMAKAYPGG